MNEKIRTSEGKEGKFTFENTERKVPKHRNPNPRHSNMARVLQAFLRLTTGV